MTDVDTGGGDRLALAVLTQYRMATTEQMHRVIAPGVRSEQTRRRLAKLRGEGLIDRITLPRAGRLRVWFPTSYGVHIASEWLELRGRRPPKTVSDPTAARLRVGHTLTVTETALLFLEDARRRGELCRPLDWLPEVHHPIGGGEAVIPDALLYYSHGPAGGEGTMVRAFVEVDRATMGPERLAAKLTSYARLYHYVPAAPGRRRPTIGQEPVREEWRKRYPFLPRTVEVDRLRDAQTAWPPRRRRIRWSLPSRNTGSPLCSISSPWVKGRCRPRCRRPSSTLPEQAVSG
ncbi:replication-relaxation family protein [Streptomyces sp. NPDC050564]|uniref:replication-relaxation family protein n=1 Tax=Streptomyces sp. NPDC050564 TaxID=3365631 RepID=UPI00379AA3CD